jgi:2-dehydro-3-deoxyphosphogluconate aldolase / (4S)-4-hydroxy-2-oxoglutarate aldolase
MMGYTKEEVVSRMKSTGVVPLFSHNDVEVSRRVLEACYNGGLTVFEYTNRQSNSFEIFSQLVKLTKDLAGFMLGIGTVMDGPTTQKFIDAGAHFIISPIIKPEMGEVCAKNNVPWIPGCTTLTEIVQGTDHGAAVVKIFPGSVLGPKFISAIRPVIPHVPLMITGGVEPTEASFRSWFESGATCLGLGSNLFSKDIMEAKDYSRLEKRVRETLTIAQTIRGI